MDKPDNTEHLGYNISRIVFLTESIRIKIVFLL